MAAAQGPWSQADKTDWQRQRLQDELSRGVHSATGPVARYLKGESSVKSEPKDAFADLTDKLNRELQATINDIIKEKTAPSRDELEQAAEEGKTLTFDGESKCFSDLSWTQGVVDAVFTNGYAYSAPLDLEAFIDWMEDDSVGSYFNEVLGRDFFAPTKDKSGD